MGKMERWGTKISVKNEKNYCLRLPDELANDVELVAGKLSISKNDVIKMATALFVNKFKD